MDFDAIEKWLTTKSVGILILGVVACVIAAPIVWGLAFLVKRHLPSLWKLPGRILNRWCIMEYPRLIRMYEYNQANQDNSPLMCHLAIGLLGSVLSLGLALTCVLYGARESLDWGSRVFLGMLTYLGVFCFVRVSCIILGAYYFHRDLSHVWQAKQEARMDDASRKTEESKGTSQGTP